MAAAQTMISHGKQRVGIRRQIHPDNVGFLVHHEINEARVLMSEAVVILPPDVRSQEIIERSDGTPPRDVTCGLEPFGMLIEHGIRDVDKGLIAGEEPMTAGEQITLQPALTHVLTQDLHDPSVWRQMLINRKNWFHPHLICGLIQRIEAVGGSLVRAEYAEVCMPEILL